MDTRPIELCNAIPNRIFYDCTSITHIATAYEILILILILFCLQFQIVRIQLRFFLAH